MPNSKNEKIESSNSSSFHSEYLKEVFKIDYSYLKESRRKHAYFELRLGWNSRFSSFRKHTLPI